MTLRAAIQAGTTVLSAAGVESPALNAEELVASTVGRRRLQVLLQLDETLDAGQINRLESLIERRARREPLQHMLGTVAFLEHEMRVTPDVLIPRPETECLAREALQLLDRTYVPHPIVLDFGTGSGCLAISIASGFRGSLVHALDISSPALEVARGNAERNGVADRVRFHQGDGFAALHDVATPGHSLLQFNLIVSNPPYVPSAEISSLDPEVRNYDPRAALDGGPDGLKFYRLLSTEAPGWLKPGGWLAMEFGDGQTYDLTAIFTVNNWTELRVEKDLSGRDRILIVRLPGGS
ncbi:MAG: peptide chain release factor N(5)-glutamine methyltransferase [Pedosphaera sp.]|nr:peptide chain release factor N(5)-glutamine methyltransferase [Pedosphaera sp.]